MRVTRGLGVVCCGHPQNNYFMLNSNKISHCVNLFLFRYKARNFKITVSSALYSRAYKLFCDKSMAANLGASSMKPGAIYLRLGFSLIVRVFRSFSVARLPVAICSRWGHLEIDRNSVRTLVKSSRPANKIENF